MYEVLFLDCLNCVNLFILKLWSSYNICALHECPVLTVVQLPFSLVLCILWFIKNVHILF